MQNVKETCLMAVYHSLCVVVLGIISIISYDFYPIIYYIMQKNWKPAAYFHKITISQGNYTPYILIAISVTATIMAILKLIQAIISLCTAIKQWRQFRKDRKIHAKIKQRRTGMAQTAAEGPDRR